MTYAPTAIDLTRITPPDAIEALSYEALLTAFKERFLDRWAEARAKDLSLPDYDVQMLETDPAIIVAQAWSYLRLLDRQRVNDTVKALLAPLSSGSNLDNLVARQNVQRLVVRPATADAPALMETDAALLRRYLLSFDKAAAGSRDGYLYDAWTAWPLAGDIRVNGYAVHGRRGDIDIVVSGPDGRLPTDAELTAVRVAVTQPHRQPEAVKVTVMKAKRVEYAANLVVEVTPGPDSEILRGEAIKRVREAGDVRMLIGGEVPDGYLESAGYGPNVIKVRDLSPVTVEPDPYGVPVLTTINVGVEVR